MKVKFLKVAEKQHFCNEWLQEFETIDNGEVIVDEKNSFFQKWKISTKERVSEPPKFCGQWADRNCKGGLRPPFWGWLLAGKSNDR